MPLSGQLDILGFAILSFLGMVAAHICMKRSRLRRGLSRYMWAFHLAVIVPGYFFVNSADEQVRAHLRRQVEGFAPTYAQEVERLGHAQVRLDSNPFDPTYLSIIEAEKRWLRVNRGVADIYTYRLQPDGKVALLCDSETDYNRDGRFEGERELRTPIGEVYGDTNDELKAAFQGVASFNDRPHTDRWGTWVSAYEPLRDASGRVEGVLGVDYPAENWVTSISRDRWRAIGFLAVVGLIAFISHVFITVLLVDLGRRKQAEALLRESEERFRSLADTAPVLIWMSDARGEFTYVNRAWEGFTGCKPRELLGHGWCNLLQPADRETVEGVFSSSFGQQILFKSEFRLLSEGGQYRSLLCTGAPRFDSNNQFVGFIGSCIDVSEKKQLIDRMSHEQHALEQAVEQRSHQLLEAERQLMQNEKLASVGQLAAGIAHEINTPIQYIGDNLRAISDSMTELLALIEDHRSFIELVKSGRCTPEAVQQIEEAAKEHDLDYIVDDTPQAIAQGLEGVQRVAHIVRAMKDFSHVQREEVAPADLNHSIQSTLTVARNEYKYHADIVTELADLPPVECFVGEVNQVLLNLLVNAAHAIADTQQRGTITIRSRCMDDDRVEISVGDTGTGIPPEIQKKVYDPFFTTKEVGKGTGQGLNIAHQIIVLKHGGEIHFDTESGKGTTFYIRLPIKAVVSAETLAQEGQT